MTSAAHSQKEGTALAGGELTLERLGAVARLSLNRPARRNAISEQLFTALRDTVNDLGRDEATRVIVFRSAVANVFCAGADIGTMADPRPAELERQFTLLLECLDAFRSCSKMIVTIVQGDCLGAGCSLAAVSDVVIAQADARFSLPEIKLDLAPVLAMAAVAPVMPARQLVYWSASGRHFSAAEAREAGLVTQVLAANELEAFVATLIEELAQAESAALALVKSTARTLGQQLSAATYDRLMKDMLATAMHPAARKAIESFLHRKRAGAATAR